MDHDFNGKVETPYKDNGLTNFKKKQRIEAYFRKIMLTLGMDLEDDSLRDTPKRVAKMYVDEIFAGLDEKNFPKITTIENKMEYKQPLMMCNIALTSNCEHHFVPIMGVAHIAYIPGKKVVGLSKLNRIVQYYGARPQVQERLNIQIANKLKELMETDHVAVVIDAIHTCVKNRGVKDPTSITRTMQLSGEFGPDEIEFHMEYDYTELKEVKKIKSIKTGKFHKMFLQSIPSVVEFKIGG